LLESRVMAQLRSRPPGWLGTAAEIAAQMADKPEPRAVEAELQRFYAQQLVRREREPGNRAPYQYGLIW
jgi:hypothetical protein